MCFSYGKVLSNLAKRLQKNPKTSLYFKAGAAIKRLLEEVDLLDHQRMEANDLEYLQYRLSKDFEEENNKLRSELNKLKNRERTLNEDQ